MGIISNELDILISILEEKEDLFIKRIEFIKQHDHGKVRFIDEKIFPALDQKQNKQSLIVSQAFRRRLGDENERQKTQAQNN